MILGEPINEGKTKRILERKGYENVEVVIFNKPDITAGDGKRHHVIPGKEFLVTAQTAAAFELMNEASIPNHFIELVAPNGFRAIRANMIPIEVVVRKLKTGSRLERHPEEKEGTLFEEAVVEIFYKDDALHDPIMVWSETKGNYELYDAHQPISPASFVRDYTNADCISIEHARQMEDMARQAFTVIHEAWLKLGYFMPDGKLEFGLSAIDEKIIVCDVFDAESYRLRRGGIEGLDISKQFYRNLKRYTEANLNQVLANYGEIATASQKFSLAV